jgi:hypothetical protein
MEEVAPTMYTYVSKCKNDKRQKEKKWGLSQLKKLDTYIIIYIMSQIFDLVLGWACQVQLRWVTSLPSKEWWTSSISWLWWWLHLSKLPRVYTVKSKISIYKVYPKENYNSILTFKSSKIMHTFLLYFEITCNGLIKN